MQVVTHVHFIFLLFAIFLLFFFFIAMLILSRSIFLLDRSHDFDKKKQGK